jgi:N-acetylglucosaminyl-diphospho-decaprenol L-rhamnosyltransferase
VLERVRAALPAEVPLRPRAGALAQCTAPVAVEQEVSERLDQLLVAFGEEEVFTGDRLDTLCRARRGDERFPGGERLEHLHAHAAAKSDGCHNDGCPVEVRRHVGHGGVNRDPTPAERAHHVARLVPDNIEPSLGHAFKHPREDALREPDRRVDIRRVHKAADEEDRRRIGPLRVKGPRGEVDCKWNPHEQGSSRTRLDGRQVALGEDDDGVEVWPCRALVPPPGGDLEPTREPPRPSRRPEQVFGPCRRGIIVHEDLRNVSSDQNRDVLSHRLEVNFNDGRSPLVEEALEPRRELGAAAIRCPGRDTAHQPYSPRQTAADAVVGGKRDLHDVGAAVGDRGIDMIFIRSSQAEQRDLVALGEAEQQLRGCLSSVPGIEPWRERRADENPARRHHREGRCKAEVILALVPTDVSVIIASHNTRMYLERCLAAIGDNREVIVVDCASTDGSQALVPDRFAHVRLVELKANPGYGGALNEGIRLASSDYLILMNADAWPLALAVERLVEFAESEPRAGVVGPRLLNQDGTLQRSVRGFPTLWRLATEYFFLRWLAPWSRAFNAFYGCRFDHRSSRDVEFVVGAVLLVRRRVLDEIGAFDTGFFMFNEEVDFCYRARSAGWNVIFWPGAEFVHIGGASTSQSRPRMYCEQLRSHLRFLAKHHGWRQAERARKLLVVAMRVRAVVFGVVRRPERRSLSREAAFWLQSGDARTLVDST